jgi:hypothetical protein
VIIEYALWWYYEEPVYIPTLSLETSKKLLNGTEGLIVPIHVGDFFKTVETRNWTAIENTWGLTELGNMTSLCKHLTPCRGGRVHCILYGTHV